MCFCIALCGDENTPHSHSYDEWQETKTPTCTENGLKEQYCTCGNKNIEVIPANGHTEKTVSGKAATCTETGLTEGKKCTVCGETTLEQEIITANGHTEETIAGKDATCTETGLTDGKKCIVCEETTLAQEIIPANGHTEETVAGKDATCTETGLTDGKKCTVCGETTLAQETIAALDHYYGDDNKCDRCGEIKPLYTRADEDTILFGTYPQTEVTDSTLKSILNSLAGTLPTSSNAQAWTSYGYYVNGSVSNYMWYIDVENGGEKYRGVYFTSYRPRYTKYGNSTSNTRQDDNGYTTSNIYWFKYEPISWTILNENNGTALILCDMIIDSQQFDYENGSYYNDYAESTVRKWLNETFYNTAFDELQKEIILTTTVDNSVASTGYSSNSYACEDTEDKVFLLSYKELTTYLTTNASRMKKTTDYAQSQGAFTSTSSSYLGNGYWWLRSPDSGHSTSARNVSTDGSISDSNSYYYTPVNDNSTGVVPALQIQL